MHACTLPIEAPPVDETKLSATLFFLCTPPQTTNSFGPLAAAPQTCQAVTSPSVYHPSRHYACTIPSANKRIHASPSCLASSVCSPVFVFSPFPLLPKSGKDRKERKKKPQLTFSLSNIIACWASAGFNAVGCAAVENQLRSCMDGPKPPPAPVNTINHHLGRMNKYLTNQGKKR